jgi:hypothetical protein
MATRRLIAAFLALAAAAASLAAQGKVFLTTDEALELAFPGCQITRKEHLLDERQRARITEQAGQAASRSIVFAYEARRDGALVGTAWFDRHRVRSLQELLMIVVGPDGRCARIEVLAFGEPVDYLPRETFYAQLIGRALDAELSTKQAIRGVAGATLTVEATVAAVRQVLATHAALYPDQQPKPAPAPAPKPESKSKPEPEKKSEPKPSSGPAGNAATA